MTKECPTALPGAEDALREAVGLGEPETRRVSPLMAQYLSPGQAFCDHGSSYICVSVGEELAAGQIEVRCHDIVAYRNALKEALAICARAVEPKCSRCQGRGYGGQFNSTCGECKGTGTVHRPTPKLAALQSPRASDDVLGEASGQEGEVERLRALVKRIEGTLDNIAEGLSDEGGRVYLNSTEDADTIRALAADVTDTVHMILYEEPGDD